MSVYNHKYLNATDAIVIVSTVPLIKKVLKIVLIGYMCLSILVPLAMVIWGLLPVPTNPTIYWLNVFVSVYVSLAFCLLMVFTIGTILTWVVKYRTDNPLLPKPRPFWEVFGIVIAVVGLFMQGLQLKGVTPEVNIFITAFYMVFFLLIVSGKIYSALTRLVPIVDAFEKAK